MNTKSGNETNSLSFSPVDLEAEKRVLGLLLKHPEAIPGVVGKLKEDHFGDRLHRRIYRAIFEIFAAQGHLSYIQVYRKLRREVESEELETVLSDLADSMGSLADLDPAIDILTEKLAKRRILEAVHQIEQMIYREEAESVAEYQSRAQELIFAATQGLDGQEPDAKDLVEVLNKCYINLINRKEGKQSYGLSVRFPEIDFLSTGFKNKDLIILAGRPSMGKTALALNFAMNVAKRDIPVLIFSLEMDDEQIGDRFVLSELFRYKENGSAVVTANDYRTRMNDEQLAKTEVVFNELYRLPIVVVDRRGLTTAEIRAIARKVKAERPKLGLIIIDYLQLIRPPSSSTKNYTLVVGDMVRDIRDLAGELDLPIILLSQLNRGVEARENKRPMMSDLRDSGNIEEFADVVIFLYREDYYYPEKARQEGTEGVTEVIFAKQRKGPTGKATLRWVPEYTRFIEVAEREGR